MQIPLQVSFRNITHSNAVENRIREKIKKLEQYTNQITSCRVTIGTPHRQNTTGRLYHIRVDLVLPGEKLVVARDPANYAHKDVYVAIRDAFEAVRRQLKKSLRQKREMHTKKIKLSLSEIPKVAALA
jgi:putative sigma-54 modulation protein